MRSKKYSRYSKKRKTYKKRKLSRRKKVRKRNKSKKLYGGDTNNKPNNIVKEETPEKIKERKTHAIKQAETNFKAKIASFEETMVPHHNFIINNRPIIFPEKLIKLKLTLNFIENGEGGYIELLAELNSKINDMTIEQIKTKIAEFTNKLETKFNENKELIKIEKLKILDAARKSAEDLRKYAYTNYQNFLSIKSDVNSLLDIQREYVIMDFLYKLNLIIKEVINNLEKAKEESEKYKSVTESALNLPPLPDEDSSKPEYTDAFNESLRKIKFITNKLSEVQETNSKLNKYIEQT